MLQYDCINTIALAEQSPKVKVKALKTIQEVIRRNKNGHTAAG